MAHLLLGKVFDVSGRVALVTGGGTGIGLMMARGLAANGAKVYIGGRRKEVVDKVAAENSDTKGKITAQVTKSNAFVAQLSLDVTNKESIQSAVDVISNNEGKLDVLINNAGQVGPRSLFFSDPSSPERKDTNSLGKSLFNSESFEEWAKLYSINVASNYFVSVACLGLLEAATKARERESLGWSSSIINITSISGQMKLAQDHFAYNSSKAAGNHLTKMLSTELALRKIPIRVNAIAPGVFPTEMTDHEGVDVAPDKVDKIGKGITKVPSERGGIDTDIVGAALYLASPASYYVNGQVLTVDGGYIAVNPSVV